MTTTTTRTWTSTKKRLTAAEKRALAHEQALEHCRKGEHTSTPTFRPGETVCTTCGIVNYCPTCLQEHNLHPAFVRAYPFLCATHTQAEEVKA